MVKVAAIVPTYNRWPKTQRFLRHFSRQTYSKLTVIVVDSGSSDGTPHYVQKYHPEVTLLTVDKQHYWAGATNRGVNYAL
ncbi:MAG: glycosyltransferase family 2 protein, partial [Leptolyngbya sp. SIO1D8]|nr:glycosyltransferase family 2 protein [Leptolyngbya sp. SIO1D8]